MRSSRLRRSAHADASRRPRARSRSTESIERIFARPFRATMLAAALPIAPFVAPLLPLAIPRNRRGLRRIRSKYADVAPVKPVTNADSFKGEFPERDVTGNSLMAHVGIMWAIVNRLLAAAAKIAKEQGDDAPEVLGLTMWALAFLLDQHTHLHIAGDETNERAAETSCNEDTTTGSSRSRRSRPAAAASWERRSRCGAKTFRITDSTRSARE